MSLLLLTFFLLYAGMHVYAFLRVRAAFVFGTWAGVGLGIFFLLMIFAPFIIRLLERAGHDAPARAAAFTGYSWLAVLFLFVSASLFMDVYRLTVRTAGRLLDFPVIKPSARALFIFPFIFSLLAAAYGYTEALSIRTERIRIESPKIPAAVGRLRIVQISDVHLGLIIRRYRLDRILEKVRAAQPDILVSTGDLVDSHVGGMDGLPALFADIQPKFGKFAIAGNHEYYAGFDAARRFAEQAGFTFLRGTSASINDFLTIAGVDDPVSARYRESRSIPEKDLLSSASPGQFVLFLKHRPFVDSQAAGLFDLQLSGHVHRGQIFPFSILTWLYYPHQSGLARLAGESWLYVSRGTGTWGPPIRFLSPPEITIIDLVHGGGPQTAGRRF